MYVNRKMRWSIVTHGPCDLTQTKWANNAPRLADLTVCYQFYQCSKRYSIPGSQICPRRKGFALHGMAQPVVPKKPMTQPKGNRLVVLFGTAVGLIIAGGDAWIPSNKTGIWC
jgi:hypothetical protein